MNTKEKQVQEWLDSLVQEKVLPGAYLSFHVGSEQVCLAKSGKQDLEGSETIKTHSLFRAYSMTKPVTCFLAMIAVQEGKIRLEDRLDHWLPAFENRPVYCSGDRDSIETEELKKPIELWHLMSHQSGIGYEYPSVHPVELYYQKLGIDFSDMEVSLEKLCALLAQAPLVIQPEKNYLYGYGIDVVAHVLERAYNKNFRDLLFEKVLKPLEMNETDFCCLSNRNRPLLSLYASKPHLTPFMKKKLGSQKLFDETFYLVDSGQDSNLKLLKAMFSGGGGLVTSISDYAKFGEVMIGKGSYRGRALLKESLFEEMIQNRFPKSPHEMTIDQHPFFLTHSGLGVGFGLGSLPSIKGGRDYFWCGAANTYFIFNPTLNSFMIFVSQVFPFNHSPMFLQVRNLWTKWLE